MSLLDYTHSKHNAIPIFSQIRRNNKIVISPSLFSVNILNELNLDTKK